MKIFAIGRNYAEHAKELGNAIPESPVVFMKPDTALLGPAEPFIYPDFSSDIHFEVEIVLRVCKQGRNIDREVANTFYDAITVGIDFTARDLQADCKAKGLPWEIAKSFDGSAAVGTWMSIHPETDVAFSLTVNGELRQQGTSSEMINDNKALVSYVSKFFTLCPGDLIFTGTPSGVGPIAKGDVLEAFIGDEKLLHCEIH
jgi:2-keto-4-pentenoate hydratase/2-oxohepta-3-ene-1,7-dioic acid hydratase in catechol pathway